MTNLQKILSSTYIYSFFHKFEFTYRILSVLKMMYYIYTYFNHIIHIQYFPNFYKLLFSANPYNARLAFFPNCLMELRGNKSPSCYHLCVWMPHHKGLSGEVWEEKSSSTRSSDFFLPNSPSRKGEGTRITYRFFLPTFIHIRRVFWHFLP